jgi:hypothetical protein
MFRILSGTPPKYSDAGTCRTPDRLVIALESA